VVTRNVLIKLVQFHLVEHGRWLSIEWDEITPEDRDTYKAFLITRFPDLRSDYGVRK
jgi:hypothetical protein